ncbi:T9SS type A sorting domain-containing protein [Hymenobacter terrenus]|uniref:T9SS type A sorting domain-containing protein n=1 Tax=Hymenobacter terrenus TaxID=1629124 RepID=UPI0012E099DA|nr:T9SS type A sorting domain-containing protein [Hymenobacter terrenus]
MSQSLFSSGHRRALATLLAVPLALLAKPAAHAQAPAWQTAVVSANGALSSTVNATATDTDGNVYIAGRFLGSATFGGTVLTSAGDFDAFVAKWSPVTNSFVWAQRAGGTGGDLATAVAVSGTNVYVAGNFRASTFSGTAIDFGGVPLAGPGDGFVARLTDAGTLTWASRGAGEASINALAVNGTSLYVAGEFRGTTTFGTTALTSAGEIDVFVAKLTDTGTSASYTWAQRAGGNFIDQTSALAVNGTDVYVGGFFQLPATFGGGALTGTPGGFMAKLTDAGASGTFVWTQPSGRRVAAVAVSGTSVYAVGDFDPGTAVFGATTLSASGSFLTKLTDAGAGSSYNWALSTGGAGGGVIPQALAVRGTTLYMAGRFFGGAAAFGTTSLSTAGKSDIFVAKLTDTGAGANFTWAQRAGGVNDDQAIALALTNTNVFVAGEFQGPSADFSGTSLTSAAAVNSFLAALPEASGPLATYTARQPSESITLAPNPAHTGTTLNLRATATARALVLLDATGRQVRVQILPAGAAVAPLNVTGLTPGLYHILCGAASTRLVVE